MYRWLPPADRSSIAVRARDCSNAFSTYLADPLQILDREEWAEEQQARFNMWAANLGVFADGHASIDHRLRDSSKTYHLIFQLLDALYANIDYCTRGAHETNWLLDKTAHVHERGPASGEEISPVEAHVLLSSSRTGDKVEDEPDPQSPSSSFASVSTDRDSDFSPELLAEAYSDIEGVIDRLIRLSALIRKSGIHQSDGRAERFVPRDEANEDMTPGFKSLAAIVINRDIPGAPEALRERILESVLRRWKRFLYRRKHQEKLSRAAKAAEPLSALSNASQALRPKREIEDSYETQSSAPKADAPKPSQLPAPAMSSTKASTLESKGLSVVAPSVGGSSKVTRSSVRGNNLDIPRPPKSSIKNNVFECPYCHILCPVKEASGSRWREHFIRDVAPYICMFEDCHTPQSAFRTSDDWIAHMSREHMPVKWTCMMHYSESPVSEAEGIVFPTEHDYLQHMRQDHGNNNDEQQLAILSQISQRPATDIFKLCEFCGGMPDELESLKDDLDGLQHALLKHVGSHLQSLAMLSLPWDESNAGTVASNDVQEDQDDVRAAAKEVDQMVENDATSVISFTPSERRKVMGESNEPDNDISDYGEDLTQILSARLTIDPAWAGQTDEDFLLDEWAMMCKPRSPNWRGQLMYLGHLSDKTLSSFLERYYEEQAAGEAVIKSSPTNKQDQERANILNWISPLNFSVRQEDILSKRDAGSWDWVFQERVFRDWREWQDLRVGNRNTLLCTGPPGAGKTIFASAVIDYLVREYGEMTSVGIAFVYCNYHQDGERSLVLLIASLLRQLLERHETIPAKVCEFYERHVIEGTRFDLDECRELLNAEVISLQRSFIIVDGLDEVDDENGTRNEFITEIFRLSPNTSFMVSSRQLPSIERQFTEAPRLSIRANDRDIESFLKSHISIRLKSFVDRDPSLMDDIVGAIVEEVNGIFIFARLWIEAIAMKVTLKDVRLALMSPPQEFDLLYGGIMTRIDGQDTAHAELARRVLFWITFARRPLNSAEMGHAMRIQTGDKLSNLEWDEDMALSACAGLVVFDQLNDAILFFHPTAQNYFERNADDWFPNGRERITMDCLTYLSFDEFKSGCCPTDEEMEVRTYKYPLFLHAARNWGRYACGHVESELQEEILKFLSPSPILSASMQAMHVAFGRSIGVSQRASKSTPGSGLWVAAVFGLAETVRLLLSGGAEVDAKTGLGETALYAAAENGHEDVVKLLLDKGANVNAEGGDHGTALLAAVEEQHVAVVKLLLDADALASTKGGVFGKALHTASAAGHEETVKLLLSYDGNAHDEHFSAALHVASAGGHEETVKLLLNSGADVNALSRLYGSAVQAASAGGHKEIVKLLLNSGAVINAEDGIYGHSLQAASANGDEETIKLLLKSGADVNAQGGSFGNALQAATTKGAEEIVKLLLDAGADVNAYTLGRGTALETASGSGNEGIVRLLLKKRADTNITGRFQNDINDALRVASSEGHEGVVQLLLEAETRVDYSVPGEETALQKAAANGHIHVVQLLLQKGGNIEVENRLGRAALLEAAAGGRNNVVQRLLENSANIDAEDLQGLTALHYAAIAGDEALAQVLLNRGAKFEAKDSDGRTALHYAAMNNNAAGVVQQLLDVGADIKAKDRQGWTALCHAANAGHEAMVQLLLSRGANIKDEKADGETVLLVAAEAGHASVVQALLENGADPNAARIRGWVSLHVAVKGGLTGIVQLLLDAGADAYAKAAYGETALHEARSEGGR